MILEGGSHDGSDGEWKLGLWFVLSFLFVLGVVLEGNLLFGMFVGALLVGMIEWAGALDF